MDLIKEKFERFGINLTEKQIKQFAQYLNFLKCENQKYNLTAITEDEEIVDKHFIDSILPIDKIPQNSKVIDVGSGAGFPGVPLGILREDLNIVLLDSLKKRVDFLSQLIILLNLKNIKCIHARAEDYAKRRREKFDVAVSRAVANMATLSEYMLPLVRVGGLAFMYKSQKGEEELSYGLNSIKILGGTLKEKNYFNIDKIGERNIYIIEKVAATPPEYPRGKNLPKLKPIL